MTEEFDRGQAALDYAYSEPIPNGRPHEVAPGVYWLRMPLELTGLNHINLWLLRDGDGWTVVDTGMSSDAIRGHWRQVIARHLDGLPITRVLCTHFHPDHVGLAGWLCEENDSRLWMTRGEWSYGRMLSLDEALGTSAGVIEHFRAIGVSADGLEALRQRGFGNFSEIVSPIPRSYRRIRHGEVVEIGAQGWRVRVGTGHAPEHACLICDELGVMIAGDQILPRITPHIGVYPDEPDGNPLQDYLDSLETFYAEAEEMLVLPSHGLPFRGLHPRLDFLLAHHDNRLSDVERYLDAPTRALSTLKVIFERRLKPHEAYLGLGEALAHLHCLIGQGRVVRELDQDDIFTYRRVGRRQAAA